MAFAQDRKTVYAVVRALEIISEASRRLPTEITGRHAEIDWVAIAAAGNVYRHEYEAVDESLTGIPCGTTSPRFEMSRRPNWLVLLPKPSDQPRIRGSQVVAAADCGALALLFASHVTN